MKLKNLLIILGILSIFVLAGCAQQQTKYVCPDGTTVSDASYCPKQESKPVETKTSSPYCGDGICNGNEKAPDCDDCKANIRIENLQIKVLPQPSGAFEEFYISNYDVVQLGDDVAVYPGYDLYGGFSDTQCGSKRLMSLLKEDFDCPGGCYFIVDSDKRGKTHDYGFGDGGFQIYDPDSMEEPSCFYVVFHLKPYPESGIRGNMNPTPLAKTESNIIKLG